MRDYEFHSLPGTPQEAKNVVMDIIAIHKAINKDEIPLDLVLKILHKREFDIDRNMLIDLIKGQSPIDRISDGIIYIKTSDSKDIEDLEAVSDKEEEKSKEKVEKMAKKALKKSTKKLSENLINKCLWPDLDVVERSIKKKVGK